MILAIPTLFLHAALAAPGHYSPAEVTENSKLFLEAAETAGAIFRDREDKSGAVATALLEYEEALDLLGGRAPPEERDRLKKIREHYQREHAVVQAFVSVVSDDFEATFEDALRRAVGDLGSGAVECTSRIPVGRQLPGLPLRMQDNPECVGEDLNVALARTLDADPRLQATVEGILSIAWPDIAIPTDSKPPIGAGDRALSLRTLVVTIAGDDLADIRRHDEDQRLPFHVAIEGEAPAEELRSLLDDARRVSEQTAAARADRARPILSAAEERLEKWHRKGEPATAWCTNPPLLGGCAIPDATADLVPRLAADRKLQKAARR
ncbi:MAG: hypothetical protein JRJ84_14985 [Deltaproteobacteria bacterium]|nr:hypothetical protein [Deltaproteobacteria bacterium]